MKPFQTFQLYLLFLLFFSPGIVNEARRAWMTYWELHLATEWERMHNLHSAAVLRTCHRRRFDNWMKITVYERTQGRTIVIYLQLESTFNQHVLKCMEKMFWPFVHQDLHRSLNLTYYIHILRPSVRGTLLFTLWVWSITGSRKATRSVNNFYEQNL